MAPNPNTVRHTETRRREGRERTLACARFFVSLASRVCFSRARATLSVSGRSPACRLPRLHPPSMVSVVSICIISGPSKKTTVPRQHGTGL